jgi:hypothetical protein
MRSLGGQEVTWEEYVEASCAKFGGQKYTLKELMKPRQVGNLETYI